MSLKLVYEKEAASAAPSYRKYPSNNPIPMRRPKIVFVFAVAIIAGTISIGMLLPIKPFVALNAFGALKNTISIHGDTMLTIIKAIVQM